MLERELEGNKQKLEVSIKKEIKLYLELVKEEEFRPRNGHITYEVNLFEKTISIAKWQMPKEINYLLWLKNPNYLKEEKTIIKNENCIYLSALNLKNVIKHLKRINNLKFENFEEYTYMPDEQNGGSNLFVEVKKYKKIKQH